MSLRWVEGGVCAPLGFRAAGVAAGLKGEGQLDLCLIVSDRVCSACGCFTANRACAAPVLLCKEHLERTKGRAKAIVMNSGNANACTGKKGELEVRRVVERVAQLAGCQLDEVLPASTGVIGIPFPGEKILDALPKAAKELSRSGAAAAAQSIMTTDTKPKSAALEQIGNLRCSLGGIAKGSGMIAPNMATMLSVITTDVKASSSCLQLLLREAVRESFNAVTVDGDTSTNDTVLLLANGMSEGRSLDEAIELREEFGAALTELCINLAKQIARDGEGASKLVSIEVVNALTKDEARSVGKILANSPLIKTAIYGMDPNWGRFVAALGRTGVPVDPSTVCFYLGGELWLDTEYQEALSEEDARSRMGGKECVIRVDLGRGVARDTVWTCDFTEEYIRINAHYRT